MSSRRLHLAKIAASASVAAMLLLGLTVWTRVPAKVPAVQNLESPSQAPETTGVPVETTDRTEAPDQYRTMWLKLRRGQTLIAALSEAGIQKADAFGIAEALATHIDPTKLRTGLPIQLELSDETAPNQPRLTRVAIVPTRDKLVVVSPTSDNGYEAREAPMPHNATIEIATGTISYSFHQAARKAGVPNEVLLQAYPILGKRVDFQREIREGNGFSLGFEQLDDGEGLGTHPGDLVFASLELEGRSLTIYRFTTSDGYTGFFDADGSSLEVNLSKMPVDGARLSSRFGRRNHPILGYSRSHKGLDFAAPRGTPVYAAGDGVVVRRHRNGSFGNYVRIMHGGGYETAYAHLSKYADIRAGARVRQGDLIGYVGATGLASGPNLHYEVLKKGEQVDPMKVESPPIRQLHVGDLLRFRQQIAHLRTRISDT